MDKPKLLLIKTGGTIGGCVPEYIEIEQIANLFDDSVNFNKHITQSFKAAIEFSEFEVCRKDSRSITDSDRNIIVQVIEREFNQGTNSFLVTHGTFTMSETGVFLIENLPKESLDNALIILTGSMYPWNVYGSDAPMNLGASISQLISRNVKGVWICMHGKLFDPRKVEKDTDRRIFG
jgi:L-asparaginase/Glu-tRNA(Gln) amidotransferase subunit D